MSKYHSTVSRRDFMKGLGLAGAGLGAAATAAPVFHDMDEVMASPKALRKLPWYIKEREFNNPTVEVDWNLIKMFDMRNNYHTPPEGAEDLVQQTIAVKAAGIRNKTPGMTLKDHALWSAFPRTQFFVGVTAPEPFLCQTSQGTTKPLGYTRTDLGLPRWEGTPEENTRMLAAAIHFFGGRDIGAVEIEEQTSKKIFYTHDSRGKPHFFEDVDDAYETATKRVIPNKCRWLVTFSVPQSRISSYDRTVLGRCAIFGAYADGSVLMLRVQEFLHGLGYCGVTHGLGFGSSLGSNTGFGVLAGNGELGRHDYVVSPKYGSMMREVEFVVTDLPLAPTKPIDAGIWRFCQVCKKCSDTCPSGAIPGGDEPTWEPSGAWNGTGRKLYPVDYQKCLPWRGNPGAIADSVGGCSTCMLACVFSKLTNASIHDVIKPIIASTSLFNSFFRTMDDAFGYGVGFLDPEDWWNRDLDTYPHKGRVIGDGWE